MWEVDREEDQDRKGLDKNPLTTVSVECYIVLDRDILQSHQAHSLTPEEVMQTETSTEATAYYNGSVSSAIAPFHIELSPREIQTLFCKCTGYNPMQLEASLQTIHHGAGLTVAAEAIEKHLLQLIALRL